MTASTNANAETLDNLAIGLSMLTTERLAKLFELANSMADPLTERQKRTLMEFAFEEIDGLRGAIRQELDDREWAGMWNPELEAAR